MALAQRRAFERLPASHQALARELASKAGEACRVNVSSSDPTRPELTRLRVTAPLATFKVAAEQVSAIVSKRRGRQ